MISWHDNYYIFPVQIHVGIAIYRQEKKIGTDQGDPCALSCLYSWTNMDFRVLISLIL